MLRPSRSTHGQGRGTDTNCNCLHCMGLCLMMWMVFADNDFPPDRLVSGVLSIFLCLQQGAFWLTNPQSISGFLYQIQHQLAIGTSQKEIPEKNKRTSAEVTGHIQLIKYSVWVVRNGRRYGVSASRRRDVGLGTGAEVTHRRIAGYQWSRTLQDAAKTFRSECSCFQIEFIHYSLYVDLDCIFSLLLSLFLSCLLSSPSVPLML